MGNEWACLGFLLLLICIYSGLALAALGTFSLTALIAALTRLILTFNITPPLSCTMGLRVAMCHLMH